MRVLLTGATGFVGSNIKPVLEQKYDVIGVGSEYEEWFKKNADTII